MDRQIRPQGAASPAPHANSYSNLPESCDHWDLPEVSTPAEAFSSSQSGAIDVEQGSLGCDETESSCHVKPEPRTHRGFRWRRIWMWLAVLALLLVVGGLGGGIARILVALRGQGSRTEPPGISSTASLSAPKSVHTSSSRNVKVTDWHDSRASTTGSLDASDATQASASSTIPTSQIKADKADKADTETGRATPTSSARYLPSTTDRSHSTESAGKTDSPSLPPAASRTPNQTFQSSAVTSSGTADTATPSSPPPPAQSGARILGATPTPSGPIYIGRARVGEPDDLEIAFLPSGLCSFTAIAKMGEWACDVPFTLADGVVYRWHGCGGPTWVTWAEDEDEDGPQRTLGPCEYVPTGEVQCGEWIVRGNWLCGGTGEA